MSSRLWVGVLAMLIIPLVSWPATVAKQGNGRYVINCTSEEEALMLAHLQAATRSSAELESLLQERVQSWIGIEAERDLKASQERLRQKLDRLGESDLQAIEQEVDKKPPRPGR